jgi:tRNA(Arg) A34 adenosine deaminase TadA
MEATDWMSVALEVAREGQKLGDRPFGAVIVKDDQVLAVEHTRELLDGDVTAHAECLAVRAASVKYGPDLAGSTIFSTHEPCVLCSAAIFRARISRVMIGTSRSTFPQLFRHRAIGIEELADDCGYPVEIHRGILHKQTSQLFVGELVDDIDFSSATRDNRSLFPQG